MLSFEEAEDYLSALPTSEYVRVLSELKLSENDLRMLRANYAAPNSTLTAKQMASLVGYKRFGASNIHYGKLGRRVADALGIRLEYLILSLIIMDWPNGECEWTLRVQLSEALERLELADFDNTTNLAQNEERWLREGKVSRVVVNAYERNATARRLCIEHYGTSCYVCGFSFETIYGSEFEGFIHVHHLKELSEIGEEYMVDPIKDLRPVCPNCHAIIHQRRPAYSVQEVRGFISRSLPSNNTQGAKPHV